MLRADKEHTANNGVVLDTSDKVDAALACCVAADELAAVKGEIGEEAFAAGRWQVAHDLLIKVALDEDYEAFLTLPAYELLG